LEKFKSESLSDYLELMQDFEKKKRGFDLQLELIIRLPSALKDAHRDVHSIDMSKSVSLSTLSTSVRFKKDKMAVQQDVFRDFFKEPKPSRKQDILENPDEPIEAIVNHIRKLLKKPTCVGISTLIMAGGFSESDLVIKTIRNEFPGLRVIVPMSPGLAVLKGAVIFGHSPDTIGARFCAQTYGICLNKEYDPQKHIGGKEFRDGSRHMCEECFEVLYKLGEVVDVGTTRAIPVHSSHHTHDRQAWRNDVKEVEIFTSISPNPTFVTDPGCKRHAVITIMPPGGKWPIIVDGKVEMEVGGTEIIVRYVDNKSPDVTSSATVNFMWYSDTDKGQVTAVDRKQEVVYYPEAMAL